MGLRLYRLAHVLLGSIADRPRELRPGTRHGRQPRSWIGGVNEVSGRSVAILAVVGIGAFAYSCGYGPHKARMYPPETAALKAIQTLNAAQAQYRSQYGRFAHSLAELGPPASGPDNASAAALISADLAAGEKQGYRFSLTDTPTGYAATAAPSTCCGSRTFYSDQSLVVRENYGPEPATARSREVGSVANQP
jgi:type IV pilus assembly protein PilA